jgi:nucleoside-diphosphate-sugar epimerase
MRIVVLGAGGQIGSAIYNELRRHHEIVGTSRKQSMSLVQFNPFHDNWAVLGKSDVVVNCAGQIEATADCSFYRIHVELTKLIVGNRKTIGNPRIIQISALGASANHKVEFLKTKGMADDYLLQHADTVVVRPSIVCTHRTMIVRKLLMLLLISRYTQGFVFVPKGFLNNQIQPVMPQDLVALVNKLCTVQDLPKVINVVGPERFTFRQIMNMMFQTNRKSYRLIQIPKALTDLLVKHGISVLFPKVITSQQYQLLFEDNIADAIIAERILGTPVVSTNQFFKNEFSYANH